jgi:hypothetical protein
VEYGEKMGVEYGENSPPQTSGMRPPIAENSANWRLCLLFSALLGWNTEKKSGPKRKYPGVECGETPLFRGWNVEKNFACKDVAYELFTFSVFHFFSQMGSLPSVSSWMRTNKPFCQPAARYPTTVGENAGQLFHDGSCATRPMSVHSKPNLAPVACRQLMVERVHIYADERLFAQRNTAAKIASKCQRLIRH